MRLPNTAPTSRPWRISELTRDFRLDDVWARPTPGDPDDFLSSGRGQERQDGAARALRKSGCVRGAAPSGECLS